MKDYIMKFKRLIFSRTTLICLTILFISLMSPFITNASDYESVKMIGFGLGTGNEQFNGLCCIAIDSSNNILTTERYNGRIQKIDNNGKFITTWGNGTGSGNGVLSDPLGIAIDSSGNVFVADNGNNRIQKFDSNGNYIKQWGSYGVGNGQFSSPSDVAIDSSGNVFVTDYYNNRIQEFDNNGYFIVQWGTPGIGIGQLHHPYHLEITPSGNIYIFDNIDNDGNRVQEFTSKGIYVRGWGSKGSGPGQFNHAGGAAIDSKGNVYVADVYNNRIQKFDSSGNFLESWGTYGIGNGQLSGPNDIAIDSNGNIFVAETGNNRIQEFIADKVTSIDPPAITQTVSKEENSVTVPSSISNEFNDKNNYIDIILRGILENILYLIAGLLASISMFLKWANNFTISVDPTRVKIKKNDSAYTKVEVKCRMLYRKKITLRYDSSKIPVNINFKPQILESGPKHDSVVTIFVDNKTEPGEYMISIIGRGNDNKKHKCELDLVVV